MRFDKLLFDKVVVFILLLLMVVFGVVLCFKGEVGIGALIVGVGAFMLGIIWEAS